MNIVRINSGLGNQMFQYAFSVAMLQFEPDTKVDISEFNYRKHHNGYELDRIFNIDPQYATIKETDRLADVSKSLLSEIRRKFLKNKLKTTGSLVIEQEPPVYKPQLLELKNTYFIGFWQSEKYFISIADKILQEFTFKIPLDKTNAEIAEKIQNTNAVSIHFRRGDYLKKSRAHITSTVCTVDYYRRAITYIAEKTDNPYFFIFSDDMDWVKENFILENAHYINNNSGKNSYRDMQLMSLCKHNIIANSSFSWWGAWLNRSADKIVCAPEIWFRQIDMPDIISENWVKIKVD